MAKILVVDDDKELAELVLDVLTAERHTVELAFDSPTARELLRAYKFDVVVLDWELPGGSGVDICAELRQRGDRTPVLMLTGKTTTSDKTTGLDSGADDYLTKPFDADELAARIRAIVRRTSYQTTNILKVRDIELNAAEFHVTRSGVPISLAQREFQLLEFLMRHPNKVFTPEALLDRVWASESDATPEAFRTCVTRLRKKLEDNDEEHPLIRNIRGVGYRLEG